ncbi:MAG: nuclear transport factor 2 family protein [Acidobacteriota bacterium]
MGNRRKRIAAAAGFAAFSVVVLVSVAVFGAVVLSIFWVNHRTPPPGDPNDSPALFFVSMQVVFGIPAALLVGLFTGLRVKRKVERMFEDELWKLEREFWTGGREFYLSRLAPEALMVFPSPAGILSRQETIEAIGPNRWKDVQFSNQHCMFPADQTAVLVYEVAAERESDVPRYAALCSSTYIRASGAWNLALHQQTPSNTQARAGSKVVQSVRTLSGAC